jgi:uncharacterized protein (TIGR00290 family)
MLIAMTGASGATGASGLAGPTGSTGPSGPRRAWMSWSSGKDSAYALYLVRTRAEFELEVVGLLTTINESAERVAMHGVRLELLRRQAAALGLPLVVVALPEGCSNEVYEQRMAGAIVQAQAAGVEAMVFGDLFLADIRAYRERMLLGTGITPVFPLWEDGCASTQNLAKTMLAAGIVATLSCVDLTKLSPDLLGRRWDAELLAELPADVDPCGEHGEFHSFVSDGPGFSAAVPVEIGETEIRGGFAFVDLTPA